MLHESKLARMEKETTMGDVTKHIAYVPKLEYLTTAVPNTYTFHWGKRPEWLQRICFWILEKMGCQYCATEIEFKTLRVDFDSIDKLVGAQRGAIDRISNGHCKYLVLGMKQLEELELTPEAQMAVNFPANYEGPCAGLTVILVPWFDGVLCLQDLGA